jgi:ABC-2 type transport system permease protein
MWTILQIELFKIFRRPRTYIGFGAITIIILIIQIGLKFDGESYLELMMGGIGDSFDIPYHLILNGYLVAFIILNTLLIHLPLLVALVAGDVVAGEANMGTLRLIMAKPYSRTQWMLAKFIASVVYTLMLLTWMAILALLVSIAFFGTNDMLIARSSGIEQLQKADILWRYLAAFGFAAIALITVAALAFFMSVLAENSIGPIVATISIVIVLTILSEMKIPIYDEHVKPFLFTSHMLAWKGFFYSKADAAGMVIKGSIENPSSIFRSLVILVVYIAIFVSTAIYIFKRKDILT